MQLKSVIMLSALLCLLLLLVRLQAVTAFFSDSQYNDSTFVRIVEQIAEFAPETVVCGGDIGYNGTRQAEYTRFHEIMQPLYQCADFFPAMGNHDRDPDLFRRNFPQVDSLTYYTLDREGVIWIILNSNLKLAPGSVQYNWLVGQLEANRERSIIVVAHHPVFSSGMHGDEKGFNLLLPQLLRHYPVAAMMSGHDHIYERSVQDSIQYVVAGGASGRLYDAVSRNDRSLLFLKTSNFLILERADDTLSVRAFDQDSNLIDSFAFRIKSEAATENPPPEQ